VGFNIHKGIIAIDKFILRPGKIPATTYQQKKKENENEEIND